MKHVVFDWDGTLFDNVSAMMGADNAIAGRFGWAQVDYEYYSTHITRNWRSYYDQLLSRAGSGPLSDEEVADVFVAWHEAHDVLLEKAEVFTDTKPILRSLRAKAITASVCSMHPHERLCHLIEKFDLDQFLIRFDGLAIDDTGNMSKTEHLRGHLDALRFGGLGISLGEIVYIGDGIDDAISARVAGIHAVLVATGEVSYGRLAEAGAPVARSLNEAVVIANGV